LLPGVTSGRQSPFVKAIPDAILRICAPGIT
jgi:hypothetical protein